MAFPDELARHVEQIRNRVPHIRGEESTKHALVVPLLQVLGYDVFDPREVQPEFIADFAQKRASGQAEKIDYAVCLDGKPVIFIECKSLDARLDNHDAQLARYFNATPSVRVAVLTNGVRLKVFADLQQPNIMDSSPWLDVDLLTAKPAEIEAIRRLRKMDFRPDEVVALAEEMVYYSAIVQLLSTQLRDPTESFVRWVASEIPAINRVTQKVVERLAPILRKATQAAILEHVARSFERTPAPNSPAEQEALAEDLAASETEVEVESRPGVVTTAEELACWEDISTWVREVHPEAPIAFRDSRNYFTIHQQNVRRWWLRMNVQKAPFWMAFRHVTAEELRVLAPGLEILDPGVLGDSRVALRSPADVPRLRAAIIAAHEKEAARVGGQDEAVVKEAQA